jgi:transposase
MTTHRYVAGPDGSPLTIADLPPPGTKRWVARRKAEVVLAVRGGLLTLQEAAARYKLSEDEFLSWQREYTRLGLDGLKATRLQTNRS